jgi:choline dehydrogenase
VLLAVLSLVNVYFVHCGSYATPYLPATYDYVIIGGGTSGLAIASRLAANASILVAVVEAGGLYEIDNPTLLISSLAAIVATGADATDLSPLIDWGFLTTSQEVR